MDYSGDNGSYFRLDLSEHYYIGALLHQLGADLREWQVANDGEYVSAEACKAWARVLRGAVADLPERVAPDVTKVGARIGQSLEAAINSEEEEAGGASLNTSKGTDLFEFFKAPHAGMIEVSPNAADATWILDFCDFLETCNGFTQS